MERATRLELATFSLGIKIFASFILVSTPYHLDPLLNQAKNVRAVSGSEETMAIKEMQDLPDPVQGYRSAILATRSPRSAKGS